MNEVNCMSEEELRAHLKKMEKNKEELKFQEQRIWKEEEEEDEQIYAALVGLEHMREYAGENEKIILLIDEQKSILDNIRLRKAEFADEFKRQLQNKNVCLRQGWHEHDLRQPEGLSAGSGNPASGAGGRCADRLQHYRRGGSLQGC